MNPRADRLPKVAGPIELLVKTDDEESHASESFHIVALTAGVSIAAAHSKNMPAAAPGSRKIVPISANWHFQMDVSDLGVKERWYEKELERSAWAKVTVPRGWDLFDEALWGSRASAGTPPAFPVHWTAKTRSSG